MATNIGTPPAFAGSTEAQLVSMRRYLYILSKDLNTALNNLTLDNFTTEATKYLSGGVQNEATKAAEDRYNTVKSMIIKNADYVRQEIDRIEGELSSRYVAQSEFGTYKESVDSKFTLQAEGFVQKIDYEETMTDVDAALAGFSDFKKDLSGYIHVGLITEPDSEEKQIGIAMGQNVTTTTDNVIEKKGYMATYTTEGLAFWDGSERVFWIKSSTLHAGSVQVESIIKQGNWQIDVSNGWTLRWIGG